MDINNGKPGKSVVIDLDEDAAAAGTVVVDENAPVLLDGGSAEVIDEDIDDVDRLPADAKKNADGSVTLPLHYPQTLVTRKDGKTRDRRFEELTLHRLTGADQRAIASASEEMMSVVAFARSTRNNQAVMNALFDKMDAADITRGGQVLNHFLSSGRKTGR